MEELLLCSGKKKSNVLLDIDFSKQSLGDRTIIDHSGNHVFSNSAGTAGTVVTDATVGKVMQMTGGLYVTQLNQLVDLREKNFDLVLVAKLNSNTGTNVPWCTGDWNGSRILGLNLSMNYENNKQHMFIDGSLGYARVTCSRQDNTQWTTITFSARAGTLSIKSDPGGFTGSITRIPFGKGDRMAIGGSYTGGNINYMLGFLKSLKITEVV